MVFTPPGSMSSFCKNTKTPGHVLENTILKTVEAGDFLNAIRNFRLRRACYKANLLCARRRLEMLVVLMINTVFIVILCAAGAKILRFKGTET